MRFKKATKKDSFLCSFLKRRQLPGPSLCNFFTLSEQGPKPPFLSFQAVPDTVRPSLSSLSRAMPLSFFIICSQFHGHFDGFVSPSFSDENILTNNSTESHLVNLSFIQYNQTG
jgi:hypothetical protein